MSVSATGVLSIDVGIKNLAVCLLNGPTEIRFWEVFDIGNTKETTRYLCNIVKILDAHPIIYDTAAIKTILIEKQPSFNPKMRVIASALHMYFVIKGFKQIKSYSAKYKLQLCRSNQDYDGSTQYAKNKKRAIDTTKFYLESEPTLGCWQEKFKKAKKKDDFADSFLQGVSYYKIYNKMTRIMKKPTKNSLKNGNLDDSHFNWLFNNWVQEYDKHVQNLSKPCKGPMDQFTIQGTEQGTESYKIEQYIEDILTNQPVIKNKLEELYGNIEDFVENKSTPVSDGEEETLEEPLDEPLDDLTEC